ncbi:hypothetical protein ACFLWZ_00410 [Chloroflexota bacterium]
MFWKKFGQVHSASKLFAQANEYWREAKQYVLEGKQKSADESLVEIIRFCQLAIESDERMGDAYILLANALMNLANQISERDSSQYDFLQSRAAAVIHFWHNLPYRNYPISKNAEIGERLWSKVAQELTYDKSLSEPTTLLDSYRDSLAAETILPTSFEKIKEILRTPSSPRTEHPWLQELLEETLSPETYHFITKIMPEVMQRRAAHEKQAPKDRSFRSEKLIDSLNYEGKITIADIEIMERMQKAFQNNDYREVLGWMAWLFLLFNLREKVMLDSDIKEKGIAKQWEFFSDTLNTAVYQARQAEDWRGLLFAIGVCGVVGVPEKSKEVLQFLHDRIGKEGAESRLQEIERRPRMLIEETIVSHIYRYL